MDRCCCCLDAPVSKESQLLQASQEGDADFIRKLLQSGVSVNSIDPENKQTPLHLAVLAGNIAIVNFLMEKNANPNAKDHNGNTPLYNSALSGNLKIANVLLESGRADIHCLNNAQRSALYAACWRGHLDIAKLLHQHGARVDLVDANGMTAAMAATEWGHSQCAVWCESVTSA